ncbi:MAG TPA: non-ribosomal peptide synthetase, partial [Thermoanaerobaculia bacterium]|nr:non-ribosomal peptide synthetase [Thermoanaerobaculia bacterium]
VTERGLLGELPEGMGAVLYLDDLGSSDAWAEDAAGTAGILPAYEINRRLEAGGLSDSQAAYILYTSGSTGQPKGAVISHAALANYLAWIADLLAGQSLPAITSLAFDASLKQLIGPPLQGRPAHILPEEAAARPAVLLSEISQAGFGALNCVPSLWNALVELVENGEAPPPSSIRRLLLGGETLDSGLLARTFAVLPEVEVINLYGPTEATANATAGPVRPGEPVTLGRPLPGTGASVVGPHGEAAPVGAFGELCLSGAGLARGYLGRPDLTAERFVPDPWSATPGGRLYRTGDRVRLLSDGRCEFRGRVDHQVKIRGFRVELGEIEALLARHPAVREAAVLVRETAPGDSRLIAWISTRDGAPDPIVPVLRTYLKEHLPAPMVPAEIAVLEALPRTPTGKVDRRGLATRAPEGGETGLAGDRARLRPYEPPADPVEEQLAGLWSELLGVEKVGRADNFFELGGHSLLATRLASRIRRGFGVELPLRTLFEVADLAALAQAVLALGLDRQDSQELAGMIAELDEMSEEEVLALLAAEEAEERATSDEVQETV